MKAKKMLLCILIISILAFPVYWSYSVLNAKCLTNAYESDFKDVDTSQYDCLHAWDEENFQIRVLAYSNDRAVVYYYSECGGEKIEFRKTNNIWQYHQTIAIWSTQGSADDYFIWPYYKNLVP